MSTCALDIQRAPISPISSVARVARAVPCLSAQHFTRCNIARCDYANCGVQRTTYALSGLAVAATKLAEEAEAAVRPVSGASDPCRRGFQKAVLHFPIRYRAFEY
jgi:hypothetical protein